MPSNRGFLYMVIMLLMVLGTLSSVAAQTTPPHEGNWIINNSTEINDEMIVLNGDLIIENGGKLTLRNVDLRFNCERNGEYKLKVEEGGRIEIYNTTIGSNTNYKYKIEVDNDGVFEIHDSTLTEYSTSISLTLGENDFVVLLTVMTVILIIVVLFIAFGYMFTGKRRETATTTIESLIGKEGIVLEPVTPDNFKGKVRVESRIWSATSSTVISKDEKIRVSGTKGINVIVESIGSGE